MSRSARTPRNIQSIRIQVFDLKDIRTKTFEAFLLEAAKAYLQGLHGKLERPTSEDSTMDRRAWHLAGKAIYSGKKARWSPAALAALCGLLTKHVPQIRLDWSHKTGATMRAGNGQRLGRIITNKADAIEVWLFAPAGSFATGDVEQIGAGGWIEKDTDRAVEIRFKLLSEAHLNNGTSEFLKRWTDAGRRAACDEEPAAPGWKGA